MIYGPEHQELMRSLGKFIEQEINPHVDEWEAEGAFPAHELFKKMGNQGFLGVCKPEEFGGMGLDYSFSLAVSETLGQIHCGAVPMAYRLIWQLLPSPGSARTMCGRIF